MLYQTKIIIFIMNSFEDQKTDQESDILPNFRSPRHHNVSPHTRYIPDIQLTNYMTPNRGLQSPRQLIIKKTLHQIKHNKKSEIDKKLAVSEFRNSSVNAEEDVINLYNDDNLNTNEPFHKRSQRERVQDNEDNPQQSIKNYGRSNNQIIKRSFVKHPIRKSRCEESYLKKQNCWSERNSSQQRNTLKQIEQAYQTHNIRQTPHSNLFSPKSKTPASNYSNIQESTHSSMISGHSTNTYSYSPFQKLMAQNHSNKKAIQCLQSIVSESEQCRKRLQIQVDLLKKKSKKHSSQQSLIIENMQLSQFLQRERFHRQTLEKRLLIMTLQVEKAKKASVKNTNNDYFQCNCQASKNLQKQIRMIEESHKTQICSLQTEIKLVKVLLENFQNRTQIKTKKSILIQTDVEEKSKITENNSDSKEQLDSIKMNMASIVIQNGNLESVINNLRDQNSQLKNLLNLRQKQMSQIVRQKTFQRQEQTKFIQYLQQQLSTQDQNYKAKLQQIDSACVLIQQQNNRLKAIEGIPSSILNTYEQKLQTLKQNIDQKDTKIQHLEEKLMTQNQTANFEIQKANLIQDILQMESKYIQKIQNIQQDRDASIKSCDALITKFKLVCQEVQRRDEFISEYLSRNNQTQGAEDIKKISQLYLQKIVQSQELDQLMLQQKQIRHLKEQNRILSAIIGQKELGKSPVLIQE